jgi:hypothetical protein
LLSLMIFFDRQGIPKALLHGYSNNGEGDTLRSSEGDEFTVDVLTLRDYSFISINTDSTTFEMHRLVQLATRTWLEAHKQQERWKQLFIRNLCANFPTGEYENWVRCQALFPHAQSAVAHQPEDQDALRDWVT